MKRQSIVWGLVVMFALVLAVQADAQTPPPPPTAKTDAAPATASAAQAPAPKAEDRLSETDAQKLTIMLLQQQNLDLRIQNLASEFQTARDNQPKLKAEVDKFIASLQKPNKVLKADGSGGYSYEPKPQDAEPPASPKTDPKK